MPTSGGEPVAESSIAFHLVHAVRGRTRLRVTPPERADELARAFARLLRDHPGVRDVRGNVDSGSIVVSYDPDVLDVDRLFAPPAEPSAARSWIESRVGDARAFVDGWTAPIRDLAGEALEQAETALAAGRRQISAAMSFWSANSVVARMKTLLQTASGSVRAKAPASRK